MKKAEPIHVKALPIPRNQGKKLTNREMWATICYYYPQYNLEEASRLSVRDLKLLLRVAEKMEANKRYEYLQIVTAPHTEKGSGVKELSEYYRKKIE